MSGRPVGARVDAMQAETPGDPAAGPADSAKGREADRARARAAGSAGVVSDRAGKAPAARGGSPVARRVDSLAKGVHRARRAVTASPPVTAARAARKTHHVAEAALGIGPTRGAFREPLMSVRNGAIVPIVFATRAVHAATTRDGIPAHRRLDRGCRRCH